MTKLRNANPADNETNRTSKFQTLFLAGFFLILIGVLVLIVAAVLYGSDSISAGALVFIGPIPIVVGAGSNAQWMILFAIILAVITIMVFLITRKEARTVGG